MAIRLMVTLPDEVSDPLMNWAFEDLRDPRDQIVFVVREALQKRGLLPEANGQKEAQLELAAA